MKRVLINKLSEGMVLADHVCLHPNQIFLKKGTTLTPSIIATLYRTNLVYVKIEEHSIPDFTEQKETVLEPSHMQQIAASEEFIIFETKYISLTHKLTEIMEQLCYKETLPNMQSFIQELHALTSEQGNYYSVMDYLLTMRDYDDSTYRHSLNVALICGAFAQWLGYSKENRDIAIFCGLFHDIGKLKVPVHILRKPSKLTLAEYEEIKKHAVYGYEILSQKDFNDMMGNHVRNSALMHHERCDGSGYPFGLKGDKVDSFAKLVAIADVYDAMTSSRVYRNAICPFKVLAHFERIGYQQYDPQMLMVFLQHMSQRYMNYSVRLNNGNVGKIVFLNSATLSKPMVKCAEQYIDLSSQSDLYIESVF